MRLLAALLALLIPASAHAEPQVSAGHADHSAGRVWTGAAECAGSRPRKPCEFGFDRFRRELARREMERRARESALIDRRREREQLERARDAEARYRRRLEREYREAERRNEARRREWWERERVRRRDDRRRPRY